MPKKSGLTDKQKRFCDEYLVDANATQAAIRAGYSPRVANREGSRLLSNAVVRARIDALMAAQQKSTIATADEVLQFLTSVLRGEVGGAEIVVEGLGDGISEARVVDKTAGAKERVKAAELLARRYGLLTDKVNLEGSQPVLIIGDAEIAE